MLSSAEYVTIGHPDRMCDCIAANLINRIQQNDGINSHAAIEVFAANDTIVFGGEVKTSLKLNKKLLKKVVEETFIDCGYTPNKREQFNKNEVLLAKDVKIKNLIHAQSPDIAIATTNLKDESGFNDQGIFYGAYDSASPTGQGLIKYFAQKFGNYLFDYSFCDFRYGSDIKVCFVAEVSDDDLYTVKSIKHITVAIPSKDSSVKEKVEDLFNAWLKTDSIKPYAKYFKNDITFTVNGTGRYVSHGFHSDSSMTGRKIIVNNMSVGPVCMQNQSGGGSMIKPFHASDLLLPLAATWISKTIVESGSTPYAGVNISCSIGSKTLDSISFYGTPEFNEKMKGKKLSINLSPSSLANEWGYPNCFDFYKMVKNNFIGDYPWFDTKKIKSEISDFIYKDYKEKFISF